MHYVGFDIGTSSLKTTVIDDSLKIVYESSYACEYDEPMEGYREIDPERWYVLVCQSLKEVQSKFSDIETIGITGQMHTTVFLDEKGEVIRPAIIWNDLRTSDLIASFKEELKDIPETKYISKLIATGSPFINSYWLKHHEPENFARVKKILMANSYIIYRLTGEYTWDYCGASTTSMYDIQSKTWSKYMMDKLGWDESYVGEVSPSLKVIGKVKETDIKVIAGSGDNPCTAIAMGVLNQEDPVISLGTSCVVIFPKKDGDFDGKGKNVLVSVDGKNFYNIVQGTVQSAGGTHRWWCENIVETNDFTVDQDKITELGKNNVLFLPHIAGEKPIHHDPFLRGAFVGLSGHTSRKDMTQAVFEGVSYGIKEILVEMKLRSWPSKIQINGGGTKSKVWMNILTNILDTDIEVVTMNATPGYGVCLLAYMSSHELLSPSVSGVFYYPQKDIVELYKKPFEKYRRIYKALKYIENGE